MEVAIDTRYLQTLGSVLMVIVTRFLELPLAYYHFAKHSDIYNTKVTHLS